MNYPFKSSQTYTNTSNMCPHALYCHFFISLSFPCRFSQSGLHLSVISTLSPCLCFPRGRRQINVSEWLASSTSAESERWENMVNCEAEASPRSKEAVQPSISLYLQLLSVPLLWLPGHSLHKHKLGQASELIRVIVGCSSLFRVNLRSHTCSVGG